MVTSRSRALKTFSSFPSKKTTGGLYGDNRPGNSVLFRHGFLEDFLQGFPAATTQLREQLSVIEEIPAQDFGYAEDEMAVRYGFEEFLTRPLAKFHYTLVNSRA
jgi:hypothetical protein